MVAAGFSGTHVAIVTPMRAGGEVDWDAWTRLIDLEVLLDAGLISAGDESLFRYVETAEEAWDEIRRDYALNGHGEDMA